MVGGVWALAGALIRCEAVGLSPSPVMLMLVDNIYSLPLLAKRASGPKHYFHSTKDRIITTKKKGTRE